MNIRYAWKVVLNWTPATRDPTSNSLCFNIQFNLTRDFLNPIRPSTFQTLYVNPAHHLGILQLGAKRGQLFLCSQISHIAAAKQCNTVLRGGSAASSVANIKTIWRTSSLLLLFFFATSWNTIVHFHVWHYLWFSRWYCRRWRNRLEHCQSPEKHTRLRPGVPEPREGAWVFQQSVVTGGSVLVILMSMARADTCKGGCGMAELREQSRARRARCYHPRCDQRLATGVNGFSITDE